MVDLFDLQNILSKFNPFSTTGIPGELHLLGHNFSGPGTKLNLRLNEDLSPKEWSMPINYLDEACYHHDIEYLKAGDDLNLKHEADARLIDKIKDYQPKSLKERLDKFIIMQAIKLKLRFGMSLVANELDNYLGGVLNLADASTVTKELHHRYIQRQRRHVYIPGLHHTLCADLMELPTVKFKRAKYHYLLTCMDGFSKYAWCYAHRDKRPQNILESLKQIFLKYKYQYLWTDKGCEFTAKVIQDYLKDHNIKWYSTQSELKCTLIERFNLTIREKLEKRKT